MSDRQKERLAELGAKVVDVKAATNPGGGGIGTEPPRARTPLEDVRIKQAPGM